ncbi:reticulophagy regulator 3-like [Neodiprion virginianus]|uniref:reticulophagy regulator 3-like n=1 Tax=Neodiprion virginianus TaxID=2961670 RepID=UPI001EE74B48|nr:reticulophagy regulator 3-like [Neodiprion virginianus]
MEKLTNIAYYFRWRLREKENVPEKYDECTSENNRPGDVKYNFNTSNRFLTILESILLWENSVNSISVVIVFNLLFWGIVVLEVRGFAAASSAALVVVLCYSTLETQAQKDNKSPTVATPHVKSEQLNKIVRQLKSGVDNLKQLRKQQPGVFCASTCAVSLGLWLTGRAISGTLLAYTILMSILVGPGILLHIPCKVMTSKEWDSEIEEFLPAVTEDNLQVLKRAGESGDQSLTPTSLSVENQIDPLNDKELVGLRMPSHEDGSTDGLELSELELSTDDVEVDGIKFQSGHFERGSSSEEEAELQPQKISQHSDDSDSEFEIIDTREVVNVKNV